MGISNFLSNLVTSASNNKIQHALDLFMFILIVFASYTLIFQETQYWYFMILIMFGFLYYFLKFRLANALQNKPKYTIHSLSSLNNKRQNDKQLLNTSVFVQDYKQRSQQQRQARRQHSFDRQRQNSYISYMNRSQKANASFSNIGARQKNQQTDGFEFLKNKSNGKLLSENFRTQFKGMNDTYIKHVQSNQDTRQDLNSRKQTIMKECMNRYRQTLTKLESHERYIKSKIKNGYKNVKKLCLNLIRQTYRQNINNLKDIVQTLQQIYDIRINCRQLPDLDKLLQSQSKKLDFSLQINLSNLQSVLRTKDVTLNLTQRKIKTPFNINNNASNYFKNNMTVPSASSEKQKLKMLKKERVILNSFFYDQSMNSITAEQLISNLKLLKEFDDEESNEEEDYELRNYMKISQQYSQKILLVFNVARAKINDIVHQYQYTLQFRTKYFRGWISKQASQFQVAETINSDNGHPQYDLKINKQPKQTLYCQYGPQNQYSVLFMYILVLQKRLPEVVRANPKLSKIVMDVLDILIL